MRLSPWRVARMATLPWIALALALALPASLFARPAAQATIAVFKVASVSEARPGQSYSYSIAVVRDGTAAVTIRDALEPALVLVSATPSPGMSCQPGLPLICVLPAGDLPAGTITLQVYARPGTPDGTIIPNQASATSGTETVQSAVTSVACASAARRLRPSRR